MHMMCVCIILTLQLLSCSVTLTGSLCTIKGSIEAILNVCTLMAENTSRSEWEGVHVWSRTAGRGKRAWGHASIYLKPTLYRTIMYGEHQGHRAGMWPHITLETLFLTSRIRRLPPGDEPRAGNAYWAAILLRVLLEESHQNATGLMEGLIVSTWKETSRGFQLRFPDGRVGLQVWPKFKKQEDLNHTFRLDSQ